MSRDRGIMTLAAALLVAYWLVVAGQWQRCRTHDGALVQGLSLTGYVCVTRAP